MITQLRRRLKSKTARSIILWVILLTLSMGMILTLIMRLFKLDTATTGFVSVNGVEASYKTFQVKTLENEQRIQLFKRYFGKEADAFLKQMGMSANPRMAALQTVVAQELLDQAANKLRISLDSDYVAKKISDPMFLQQEFGLVNFQEIMDPVIGLNYDALQYQLRMMGLTVSDFEEMVANAMKREMLAKLVSGSIYVPMFEVKNNYVHNYLARKFAILKFDFNSFFKEAKKNPATKAEIKSFYDVQNELARRYWVPEKRAGKAYIFDPKSYGVTVEDDEIQRYYDDNKMKSFVEEPAKIQVRRILFNSSDEDDAAVIERATKIRTDLLLNPSTFAQVAKEVSEDKETAKEGGLVPLFARGERDRELEKAAFLLKEDGDISELITTQDGYEIVQRVTRQDPKFKPLTQVKAEIKDQLVSLKFKRLFSEEMSKLLARQEFSEDKLKDVIKIAPKTENIPLQVANESKRLQALFRIRENIPAFYFEDGKGILVTLAELQEKHLPELSTIEDTVTGDYYEKKASEMLNKTLEKARNDAKTKTIEELKTIYGKQYTVSSEDTEWLKKSDQEKLATLRSKGYPVEQILGLEKVGFTDTYRASGEETADGYVVKLTEIEKINEKEYAEKKDEMKNELERAKNMGQLEEFIAFLRKKAKIITRR